MRARVVGLIMISSCAVFLLGCSSNATSGTFPTIASSISAPSPAASATPFASAHDPFVAVLQQYGWTPQGEPTIQLFLVPETTKPPFLVALQASQTIGLDFSSWQGQTVNQRTYWLGREPKENREVFGNLLSEGERVIGAWLFVKGQYPGVHPLTTQMDALVGDKWVPRWVEYQAALAGAIHPDETGMLCEWDLLGQQGREVYVWAMCLNEYRSGAAPAVIQLGENGEIEKVTLPREGSYYSGDVRRLFPPEVQPKVFAHGLGSSWGEHSRARLKDPSLPPLIVVSGTPLP